MPVTFDVALNMVPLESGGHLRSSKWNEEGKEPPCRIPCVFLSHSFRRCHAAKVADSDTGGMRGLGPEQRSASRLAAQAI